jgi:FKBP-type peptidyl-prolyl cis-trans isomerase SlyD
LVFAVTYPNFVFDESNLLINQFFLKAVGNSLIIKTYCNMTIEEKKVVSLTYELRVNDEQGEIVEKVEKDSPLTFLFGSGNLLPDFEANISGLKEGESFSFSLEPERAYGQVSEEAIVELPKDIFEVDGKIDDNLLKVGNNIPMQDNTGNRLNGIVQEIGQDVVKMDFNHPLAGDTLYFKGEVEGIRDATQEEVKHGHVHQGGSHSCGGGDSAGHCCC